MNKIPERFVWAAERLDIQPSDRILEIGCGAGLLAEEIAGKLLRGSFVAIDQSPAMLEKAKKRNGKFIEQGISEFLLSNFAKASLPETRFDKIVAFNVNFFWKNPKTALQKIREMLVEEGKLYVLYQSPFEIDLAAAQPVKKKLLENSFDILDIRLKKFSPAAAFCIEAKPSVQA